MAITDRAHDKLIPVFLNHNMRDAPIAKVTSISHEHMGITIEIEFGPDISEDEIVLLMDGMNAVSLNGIP